MATNLFFMRFAEGTLVDDSVYACMKCHDNTKHVPCSINAMVVTKLAFEKIHRYHKDLTKAIFVCEHWKTQYVRKSSREFNGCNSCRLSHYPSKFTACTTEGCETFTCTHLGAKYGTIPLKVDVGAFRRSSRYYRESSNDYLCLDCLCATICVTCGETMGCVAYTGGRSGDAMYECNDCAGDTDTDSDEKASPRKRAKV